TRPAETEDSESADDAPADSSDGKPAETETQEQAAESPGDPQAGDASEEEGDINETPDDAAEESEPNATPDGDDSADSGQFNVLDDTANADDEQSTEVETEDSSNAPPETDEQSESSDNPATESVNETPESEPSAEADEADKNDKPVNGEEPAIEQEPAPAAQEVAKKYQPLEEVADQIRQTIARDSSRVLSRRQEILKPILEAMDAYSAELAQWRIAQDAKAADAPDVAKPKMPNIQNLADEAGLKHETVAPVSVLEFADAPLGRSFIIVDGRRTEQLFAQAFRGRLEAYRAVMTEDVEGHAYVVWQTTDHPADVPELKDVRSEVVHTWKLMQARKLAQQEAERLAEAAKKSNQPLREYFAERKDPPLIITEPFTWLTYGPVPGGQMGRAPRLATLDEVPNAGPEFMAAVSKLEQDQVGVAANHPQTVYYVARVARHDVPLETLRKRFLQLPEIGAARDLARSDLRRQLMDGLRESVAQEARLDWIVTPDTNFR
ncbi:MAG: hypothetical protein KDA42_17360, partial [Planctomycetales bacterium]|nr:hypothetical protein [Planctomycetales bacterium]